MYVHLGTSVLLYRHPAQHLGVKHLQLPVNFPFGSRVVTNYQRDGHDAHYIRVEHQIITPTASAGHRTCQCCKSQFSVSGTVGRWGCCQCVLMYHVEPENC